MKCGSLFSDTLESSTGGNVFCLIYSHAHTQIKHSREIVKIILIMLMFYVSSSANIITMMNEKTFKLINFIIIKSQSKRATDHMNLLYFLR